MYSRIYNLHVCGAIFYNHESPKRSKDYVTKKIVQTVCEIYHGKKNNIYLGDISARIDWGYAKDYVETAHRIMQLSNPDVFIIGSGKCYSIEYFTKKCLEYVGLNYKKYLRINKKLLRSSKTASLIADTSKAKRTFNFKIKTNLDKLISIMMDNDLEIEFNGK